MFGGEKQLTPDSFRQMRQFLHQRLISLIEIEGQGVGNRTQFDDQINRLLDRIEAETGRALTTSDREILSEEVRQEVLGLGPLAPLMMDPTVSDILINGPDEVWVDRHGKLSRTTVVFDDESHLRRFIDRLIAAQGKHLDTSSPAVDARLPDGSRLHVVIPPLCAKGTVVSIRRFRDSHTTAAALVAGQTLSQTMLDLLAVAVSGGLNIIISGGAAAGKTTLLNAISEFIPDNERVVTIEESAELNLRHDHVISLEARQGNSEGRGKVDLRLLLRNALRMRADRIIVGEVRGYEVFEMLQAMTVGHDGSLTTVHANNPHEVLKRLESLALLADVGLPREAIRDMIGSAVDLIVQVARFPDGRRCVTSICEVLDDNGLLETQEIFTVAHVPPQALATGEVSSPHREHLSCHYQPLFLRRLSERGYNVPAQLRNLAV